MDIEKNLNPRVDELIIDAHGVNATIYDAELDPIKCSFTGESTVVIDCSNYGYIELSLYNLKTLKRLINRADEYIDMIDEEG